MGQNAAQNVVAAELAEFIARVGSAFPLERAILFGSRARGDHLRSSDYDVVLALEEGIPLYQRP